MDGISRTYFPAAHYGDDLVRYLRAQLDGSAYLQACLASHLPVDLVVIMLGSNDLKPVFNRTPLRIAIGAARLIDLVNTLNRGVGTSYKNPKVLLICPPALDPKIEKGPVTLEIILRDFLVDILRTAPVSYTHLTLPTIYSV